MLSLLLWWATEGCGLVLTGSATDLNSGPLLVIVALACRKWRHTRPDPIPARAVAARKAA